ncbi:hypothetical protein CDD80_5758 [Ophiocordyceps camponoti-rufipedis]|uniref:Uncharacterized protein n=1 Tax=Ophiocordyceps camponoti-rufipedis TaxID=2004952 RepID=A0A2C5YTA2_9HYPO|nr:hypothetical protein CDD80_5758 [Ophiocordyceps camponoti-rufipedis]
MAAPVPASHHHLEAGLLSTGDDEKTPSLAPPPQPPRRMSTLRRLTLAIILGLFLGLGLSLAKDYATGPCHYTADRAVELQDRFDTADLLRRLLHSWFPAHTLGRSPAAPPLPATDVDRVVFVIGSFVYGRLVLVVWPFHRHHLFVRPLVEQSSFIRDDVSFDHGTVIVDNGPRQDQRFHHSAATTDNYEIPDDVVFDPRGNVLFSSRYVHDERSGSIDAFVLQCSSLHAFSIIFIFIHIPIYTYIFALFFFHISVSFFFIFIIFSIFTCVHGTRLLRFVPGHHHPLDDVFYHQVPMANTSNDVEHESDSPTSTQSSRRTMTTGRVSTSSAVPTTWTTTLHNGGVTTLTSTSWVDVVPSQTAATSSRSNEAGLQNAAPANKFDAALFAMAATFAGAVLLV